MTSAHVPILISADVSGSLTPAHAALLMDRPHGLLEPVAAHNDRDSQLARPLRDGDNIHIRARDRREDAPGQAWRAVHPFADHCQQPHIFIHLDRAQIAMRQLQSQRCFQSLNGRAQLFAPHQHAKTLAETGAR